MKITQDEDGQFWLHLKNEGGSALLNLPASTENSIVRRTLRVAAAESVLTQDQAGFILALRTAIEASKDFDHETSKEKRECVTVMIQNAFALSKREGFVAPREAFTELPVEFLTLTSQLLLQVMTTVLGNPLK